MTVPSPFRKMRDNRSRRARVLWRQAQEDETEVRRMEAVAAGWDHDGDPQQWSPSDIARMRAQNVAFQPINRIEPNRLPRRWRARPWWRALFGGWR
jgi:hypothetical protein